MRASPTIRYALFYAAYFSFVALEVAFFPVYFRARGFTYLELAVITVAPNIAVVLAPILLFRLVRVGPSLSLISLSSVLVSFLFFLPLLFVKSYFLVIVFVFFSACFLRVPLIIVESSAIQASFVRGQKYGPIRLWGSLGFIVATYLVGGLIDRFGVEQTVLYAGLAFLAGICATVLFLRKEFQLTPAPEMKAREVLQVFQNESGTDLIRLLLSTALLWASLSVLYIYFSLHLTALSWSGVQISTAWTIGVVAEISMFLVFDAWERRSGLISIFRWSIFFSVIRWVILSLSADPRLIFLSQLLHAFTFGSFHLASMKLIYRFLPAKYSHLGQGLLMSLGTGLGVIVGRILGGLGGELIPVEASVRMIFPLAVIFAVGSLLVARKICRSKS